MSYMIRKNLLKDYGNDTISWSVASLFAHDRFIWELLRVCENIEVGVPIKSVYGSIPCKFQGGVIPVRDVRGLSDAEFILRKYDDIGVSCRLTFSNHNIPPIPCINHLKLKISQDY